MKINVLSYVLIACLISSCSSKPQDLRGSWKLESYYFDNPSEDDKQLVAYLNSVMQSEPELILFFTASLMGNVSKQGDSLNAVVYTSTTDSITANEEVKHYKFVDDETLMIAQGKELYWRFKRQKQ